MYEIVKNVITSKSYELTNILTKIDTLWVQGSLTEVQRTELISLARQSADPAASYAPLQEQVNALANQLDALTARVSALEQSGETGGEEPEQPAEEWPEYVQPTGAHDAYHNGDKVTWNGQRYTCIAPDGTACVWDPDTYPAYWQEEADEEEGGEEETGDIQEDSQ